MTKKERSCPSVVLIAPSADLAAQHCRLQWWCFGDTGLSVLSSCRYAGMIRDLTALRCNMKLQLPAGLTASPRVPQQVRRACAGDVRVQCQRTPGAQG